MNRMQRLEELAAAELAPSPSEQFYNRAVEATKAAELAFEESSWKEGGRYLKLANTWISLLAAVVRLEKPPTESG
jgi:hypothetical protein